MRALIPSPRCCPHPSWPTHLCCHVQGCILKDVRIPTKLRQVASMKFFRRHQRTFCKLSVLALLCTLASECWGHGTVVYPKSRVLRVYEHLNGSGSAFPLAATAIQIDGSLSYYTWNEVSRNIPQAVTAGLPAGYDYSPWMPDGALASAGRTDPTSPLYPRTYAGLDQTSDAWPTTPVTAGQVLSVDYYATAPHNPSVWDVWMTTNDWDPNTALNWAQMEFLGRPTVTFTGSHYLFDVTIPTDRCGHHVLWVAWQRDDPAGEVFISASDLMVQPAPNLIMNTSGGGIGDLMATASCLPPGIHEGFTLLSLNTSGPVGQGSLFGIYPDALTYQGVATPPDPTNPLHFIAPINPAGFPLAPISLPPGYFSSLSGQSMDAQIVLLDSTFTISGITNVARVAF